MREISVSFDEVNSPAHYAGDGRQFEVIDVLEDWASRAPDPVQACLLFSALKYLGRLYDKGEPITNARKSVWYLSRLIQKLEDAEIPFEETPERFVTYDDILNADADDLGDFGTGGYTIRLG
jgi:hypothetical protein